MISFQRKEEIQIAGAQEIRQTQKQKESQVFSFEVTGEIEGFGEEKRKRYKECTRKNRRKEGGRREMYIRGSSSG